MHQNCLEGWLKHRLLGPIPIVSDSVGLGWGLIICIAKTFPGDADAANLGNRVREPQFYRNSREAAHISIIYLICCRLFIPHQILKQTEDCFSIFPRIPKGRSLGLSEESPPKDHRQFFILVFAVLFARELAFHWVQRSQLNIEEPVFFHVTTERCMQNTRWPAKAIDIQK